MLYNYRFILWLKFRAVGYKLFVRREETKNQGGDIWNDDEEPTIKIKSNSNEIKNLY